MLLLVSAPPTLRWSGTASHGPLLPLPHPFNTLCFLLNKIQIPSMTFSTNSGPGNTHTHIHSGNIHIHRQTLWKYTYTRACMRVLAYPFLFLVIFFCYISVYLNQTKLLIVLCVLFFPIPVMHHQGRSISLIPLS